MTSGFEQSRRKMLLPFVLPALVLYLALFVLPSLASVVFSFTKWSGLGSEMTPNGVANYTRMFANAAFWTAFGNTLLLTLIGGVVTFAITFGAMIVLRDMKGRALVRSVVFVPYIISPIAIGVAAGFMLNPDGAVNTLLRGTGLDALAQAWLSPEWIFKMIVIAFVWSVSGFYVSLLMTGVDSIPVELYEAADLAGATRWQQFTLITFPLTRDILATAVVLWAINGVKVFEMVIAFTGTAGTPPREARTIAVSQYLAVTGGKDGVPDLGYASAIGVVIFLLSGALVLLVRRLLSSEVYER